VYISEVQTQSKDWAFSNKDKDASGDEFSYGGSDRVWVTSLIRSKLISSGCCHDPTRNFSFSTGEWDLEKLKQFATLFFLHYMQLEFWGLEEGGVTYLAWMKCGVR